MKRVRLRSSGRLLLLASGVFLSLFFIQAEEIDRRILELSLQELMTLPVGEEKGFGLFFDEHNRPDQNSTNIGLLVPFKNLRQVAVEHIAAAEFAAREINMQGGINGRRLVVVRADDNEQLNTGVGLAEQLIKEYQIKALLGPLPSQNARSVIQNVTNQHTLLHFLPAANANELDRTDTKDQVFRLAATNNQIVEALVREIKRLGLKKSLSFIKRDIFGREIEQGIEQYASQFSYQVVHHFSLSPLLSYESYNLTDEFKTMQKQGAEAIVLPLLPIHFKGFFSQLRANWKGDLPVILQPEHVSTSPIPELFDASRPLCVFASVPEFSANRMQVLQGISSTLNTDKTSYTAAIIYDSVYLIAAAMVTAEKKGLPLNQALRYLTDAEGQSFTKRDFSQLPQLLSTQAKLSFIGESGKPVFDEMGNNRNIAMTVVGFHDHYGPGCER